MFRADFLPFASKMGLVQIRYRWRIPLDRTTMRSERARRDLNHADGSWTLGGMQNRSAIAAFAGHLPGSCVFADPRLFTMDLLPDHLMTFSRVRQWYQIR
jgi:hypothetical protein